MGKIIGDAGRSGTEIDIMEYLTVRGDTVQHTLHWDGYGKDHQSQAHLAVIPGLRQGFHTFGLEWKADGYIFYIDRKETWRTEKAVSHINQYIILSLEVGKWAGDIRAANLPDSNLIDYVKVYQ